MEKNVVKTIMGKQKIYEKELTIKSHMRNCETALNPCSKNLCKCNII